MMKHNGVSRWCSASAMALLVSGAAYAQERESGFYFKSDIGPAWAQDVQVKDFVGIRNFPDLKFDVGVRFDIAGGYQFNRYVGAELETGFIYNEIKDLHSSSLSSVPIMGNVVFQAPLKYGLTPFIGGGVGGVSSIFFADNLFFPLANTFVDGTESTFVFAWQGFAGLKYRVSDQFNVSLAYRYLGLQSPTWDVESIAAFGPTEHINFGQVHTHAVVFGVNFLF